jgi:hypothetical protein
VRGTTEGRRFVGCSQQALLEGQIGPSLITAVILELASGIQTTRLSLTHLGGIIWILL